MSRASRQVWDSIGQTAQVFTRTALSGVATQEALGIGRTPSYATGLTTIIPSWYTEAEVQLPGGQQLQGSISIYCQERLRHIDRISWNGDMYEIEGGPQSIQMGASGVYNRYIINRTITGGNF
jgi:hypothetical protein